MAWSKVNKPKEKPIKWWYHKLLCEFGWWSRQRIGFVTGMRIYYNHLDKLCKLGYNLYGDKI